MKRQSALIIAIAFINILGVLYFIYGFSITKNEPTEQEIKDYMENSDTLTLYNVQILEDKEETYSHPFIMYSKIKIRETVLVKASNYTKYFSLEIYDTPRMINTRALNDKEIIHAVVNRTDFNNPKFGTKEKPVSVLLFYTNKNYINYYVNKELYHSGVKEYMTYVREK